MNFLQLDTRLTINKDMIDAPNLCDRFSKEDLQKIGGSVWDGFDRDLRSRSKWERRMEAGMDLAMQIQKDKNFPWPGASNVIFPLVTIAALQFSARSYGNIISGTDVVRYRVVGEDNPQGQLRARADRISAHMSWQMTEEDPGWEEQHDRLLINLGIVGTNFIKSYYNSSVAHNTCELVQARDFVIDYWAKSVEAAARKTHIIPLYRNEIYEKVLSDVFQDVRDEAWYSGIPSSPLPNQLVDNRQGTMPPAAPDEDTPFSTLEQHRLLDLDHDGYAEPYIVTIEKSTKTVLRIVARWEREEDIERTTAKKIIRIRPMEYFTKFSFIPAPDGGIYDVGFGTLLGPLNESVNTGINQLLDAGTMQNSNGGFLGRGAKIRGGVYTMAPWEWRRVDSTGDDLRKSLVQLPVRELSNVMFQLLGLLISYTDRVAGTVDQMVGENPGQNTPAETSRNMTEQGMQVYSMIFKRVWRSLKEEFKKCHRLNAIYLPSRQRFGAEGNVVLREDYNGSANQVVPSADPNITSNNMRYIQAQMMREAAHSVSGYDIEKVERNFLRALRVDGAEQFFPGPGKVPPLPDQKAQIEQMKLQAKSMQLEFDKQKFVQELMDQRQLNMANIALIKAQIIKLFADASVEQSAQKVEAFKVAVEALETHNSMINDRIGLLQEVSGGGEASGPTNGGGVQGMASPPSDAGAPAPDASVGGGAEE